MYSDYIILIDDTGQPYIAHHGIKGQKWGIRRYQNEDGSLTPAGVKRYGEHGADYLKAKSDYKVAKRHASRMNALGSAADFGISALGHPIVGSVAKTAITYKSARAKQDAKDELTRKKHDMLYETGKRKKLDGPYQTTGDDEVKYGYRGAKRIAKRQNKGLSREQAERPEKIIKGVKTAARIGYNIYKNRYNIQNNVNMAKTSVKNLKTGVNNLRDSLAKGRVVDDAGNTIARFSKSFLVKDIPLGDSEPVTSLVPKK